MHTDIDGPVCYKQETITNHRHTRQHTLHNTWNKEFKPAMYIYKGKHTQVYLGQGMKAVFKGIH